MGVVLLLSGPLPARAALIAGAIGAVAITVLYLVRLRRRRVVVSFAPLWLDAAGPRRTTSWARRLRDLLSLMLAMTVLGLLLLAAVDPRPTAADRAGRSVVILIDRSASMAARDGSRTRLDAARARAIAIVDGLAAADRALIASFASDAVAETGFEADAGRLRRAVAAVAPSEEPGDLPRALTFASGILRGRPRPTVVLVSDGAFSDEARRTAPGDLDVRFAPVGQVDGRRGNVGIISFAARRTPADPSAVEAALVVQNFGARKASVAIDIAAGGATVERLRLELAPGERRRHQLPNVFAPDARLQARLAPADDLAIDDTAYAVVPPLPHRRILRVGGADLYLDGALLSLGRTVTVDRLSLSAAEAQRARWPDYDLVVFDSVTPAAPPPTHGRFLYLDAHGAGSPFAERGSVRDPVIADVRRDHPLVRQVDLGDVNIAAARRLALAPGDISVAGSFGVPLLIARERIAATSFDPRRSDLPMRPAFPLLIANALAWAGPKADATIDSPPALLTGASARPREDLPEVSIAHAGFHQVGDMVVAANLGDVRESDTTPSPELELGGRKLAAPDPPAWRGGIRWGALALWLALALLLFEWVSYHRRWTT
jgi:VWA domain-containing protein